MEARLKKEPSLKQANIDVETDQGVVTLTGKAPSLRASVRASELAHRITGVRAVQNELDVPDRDKRG